MRVSGLLLLVLLLVACRRDKPVANAPADTVPVAETPPPVPAGPAEEDDYDSDLYHISATDTILPGEEPPVVTPMAVSTGGLPVGPTIYLADEWCGGFVTGTVASGMPSRITAALKKADQCNMRVAFTVPRTLMTTNGQQKGEFSPTRARRAVDEMAAVFAKMPESYRDNLLYVSVLDDMACKECWSGGISKEATASHTRYARSKFPAWVPVGLRVDPVWMLGIQEWGVDVTTAQWHMKKGPRNLEGVPKQKAWYEATRLAAPKVGVKRIIYTVNVHECIGVNSRPCTAGEVRAFGETAINFDPDQNCGFLAWRYDGVYFQQNAYQDAWKYLVNLGRNKPKVLCKA